MLKTTLTAASLALVAFAAPASAGAGKSTNVDVTIEDLDLSTAEGQAKLDRRIDVAARTICQMDSEITGSRIKNAERRCYKRTRNSVKRQVAALIEDSQRGG